MHGELTRLGCQVSEATVRRASAAAAAGLPRAAWALPGVNAYWAATSTGRNGDMRVLRQDRTGRTAALCSTGTGVPLALGG